MAVRDLVPLSAPRLGLPALVRRLSRLPFLVHVSIAWLVLMIVIAFGADMLAPYSITAFDLKARLTPPVLMGGGIAHPLGSDELGRDVLSRLMLSIRMSLLIALFGTMIAASVGTALGFLAAHFRGRTEQLVLVAIDFQASMPFMIIALSVLAFFGNSLPLFIGLMASIRGSATPASRAASPSRPTSRAMPRQCASSAPGRCASTACTCCPTSPRR